MRQLVPLVLLDGILRGYQSQFAVQQAEQVPHLFLADTRGPRKCRPRTTVSANGDPVSGEQGDKEDELVLVIRGELLKKYPTAVIYAHRAAWERNSDGTVDNTRPRKMHPLTPEQAADPANAAPFDRKKVIGLHHLALRVESQEALDALHDTLKGTDGVSIEFAPEPLGGGPVRHMMTAIPGGIRVEFIAA